MLFHIHCLDRPDAGSLRTDNRPAHLDYLKSIGTSLMLAGPLLADDGATAIGSVLVVDRPTRADAESFAAGDPYAKAGLFRSVTITAWRKTILNPPAE